MTLADNTVVYGIFGSESYASSVAEERDLYLQQVLAEGFKEVDDVSGMWISASDIKRMEIFWQEDQSGHKRYIFSEYVGRMTKEWVKTLRSLVTRHPGEEESTMTEEEMENGREK